MCFVCLSLFALWRIDNQRAERIRMALVDRFVPTIDWSFGPINSVSRIFLPHLIPHRRLLPGPRHSTTLGTTHHRHRRQYRQSTA